jgi:mono/diheme cytochrome c family protein
MRSRYWLVTLIGLTLGGRALAHAQGDSVKSSPAPGVYSDSQATRGAEVYRTQCGRCHSPKDHSGADFQLHWNGLTVKALYDYLRSTMPDDDPGTLSEDEYLTSMAYIFRLNGMPAGSMPVTNDTTVLKKLTIDIKWPRP